MKRIVLACVLGSGVLVTSVVSAQEVRKPGLWETTMSSTGGPPIPPEQAARMKQLGIGQGNTRQVCITPEMAARDENFRPPGAQDQCKVSDIVKTSSSLSSKIPCDGTWKGSGTVKVTHPTNDAYTGRMDFTGTGTQGPVEMHQEFTGKWISSDCGNVKPRPLK